MLMNLIVRNLYGNQAFNVEFDEIGMNVNGEIAVNNLAFSARYDPETSIMHLHNQPLLYRSCNYSVHLNETSVTLHIMPKKLIKVETEFISELKRFKYKNFGITKKKPPPSNP